MVTKGKYSSTSVRQVGSRNSLRFQLFRFRPRVQRSLSSQLRLITQCPFVALRFKRLKADQFHGPECVTADVRGIRPRLVLADLTHLDVTSHHRAACPWRSDLPSRRRPLAMRSRWRLSHLPSSRASMTPFLPATVNRVSRRSVYRHETSPRPSPRSSEFLVQAS
jgi:hypothetical protein